MGNKSLKLGWWNSGLSPIKKRSDSADHGNALAIIAKLLFVYDCDFLGISELSPDDVNVINETLLRDSKYKIEPCFDSVGRGSFKQAYIYNSDLFQINSATTEEARIGTSRFRVAHFLTLDTKFLPFPLFIYASHWPSLLHHQDHVRDTIGSILRQTIDNLLDATNDEAHIILMGDYNSEPFSNSILKLLQCIRDPNQVKINNRFLYNPFWRHLGLSDTGDSCGSYFYKGGVIDKWHLFDQIMFSPKFLENEIWTFAPKPLIVNDTEILGLIKDRTSHFDHLPVLTTLDFKHD